MANSRNYFFLSLLIAANGYEIWHPVDVPMIVCTANGAPGHTLVEIDLTNIAAPSRVKPHIFTFYRTSANASDVTYTAVDSAPSPQVVMGTTTVSLQAHNARRLGISAVIQGKKKPSGRTAPVEAQVGTEDLLEAEEDQAAGEDEIDDFFELEEDETWDAEKEDDKESDVAGRMLKASGSRSRFSTSRRSPPSNPKPAPKPSPRPAPKPVPKPTAIHRRRGVPYSPTPTSSPVDGSRYSNPTNSRTGSYGYGSTSTMNRNYPTGYSNTGYGYSGSNAYKSSSNSKIMMAGGAGLAGGMVAGMGMAYMYSRWNSNSYYRNQQCSYSSWSGSCRDCYQTYSRCQQTLPENAARDDLMDSGFIPADFISPITVNFTAITGVDFAASRICPPQGWNPDPAKSNVTWEPPMQQDLFLTLTMMTEFDDELYNSASYAVSLYRLPSVFHSLMVSVGLSTIAICG